MWPPPPRGAAIDRWISMTAVVVVDADVSEEKDGELVLREADGKEEE